MLSVSVWWYFLPMIILNITCIIAIWNKKLSNILCLNNYSVVFLMSLCAITPFINIVILFTHIIYLILNNLNRKIHD